MGVKGVPGWQAKKTHCKRGHPLTGDNLVVIVSPKHHNYRRCVACARMRMRGYAAQRRVENKRRAVRGGTVPVNHLRRGKR